MAHTWDPERYRLYDDERGRPFLDLLTRVRAEVPRTVVDLGCGPGNLTALLKQRWPDADVRGIDSSPEMIEAADAPGVSFEVDDLRTWTPPTPVDVLLSNATLQWLPDHLLLLPRLLKRVAPGGWIAFQVPGNFGEPSHTIRTELAAEAPYAAHTRGVAVPASHEPVDYLRALQVLDCEADVWETTYLHVLTGADPVFAWVAGTGARPTLQALPDDLRAGFEEVFRERLAEAYPADADGRVILPFRRIFAVAQKPEALR